ncbi:unnamed protein product [Clonostachys byssicola]|uniref:JmjC domain-containing protein n=1 Tax=Clonostachys byssicola TaxID=160290 RepID=A0A9N9UEA4_9HYPO|nr:unnamed protein product [Clonostachys byssicola]
MHSDKTSSSAIELHMAPQDPTLTVLLEHASRIEKTLDAVQEYVQSKSSQRQSRRVVSRSRHSGRTEHTEVPPWLKDVTALLNTVRDEARSLRSETQALAARQQTPMAARSKFSYRHVRLRPSPDRRRSKAARDTRLASSGRATQRRLDSALNALNAPAAVRDLAVRSSRRATEVTATSDVVATSSAQGEEASAAEPPTEDRSDVVAASSAQDEVESAAETPTEDRSNVVAASSTQDEEPSAAETPTQDQNASMIAAPNGSTSSFTLTSAEMGEGLIPALEKIIPHPDFHNEILVPHNPIDPTTFRDNLDVCADDCQYTKNTFQRGPKGQGYGFVFAPIPTGKPVALPENLEAAKTPTIAEARQYLNDYVENLPTKPVFYYSGHADSVPNKTPLHPGHEMLANKCLSDLHHPYYHVGVDRSANRVHWEDLSSIDGDDLSTRHGLRSANVVLYGVKLWILIAMNHTAKFEKFVSTYWNCNTCGHRVGHQSLLIAPWRLDKEGIDFTIHVATPGKMIVPDLCQYHYVVNMGFCIAQSINFKLAGDGLVSSTHASCDDCGLKELSNNRVAPPKTSRKRRAQTPLPVVRPKKRVQSAEVAEVLEAIRKADSGCIVPQVDKSDPWHSDVVVMAAAIQSSLAIAQFVSLVREWRSSHDDGLSCSSDNSKTSVEYQIKWLQASAKNLALGKFVIRLCQMRLAQEAEKIKQRTGLKRIDSTEMQVTAEKHHMGKKELGRHLEEGRWWMKLCGPYEGLLPFLLLTPDNEAPFDIKKKDWYHLVSVDAKLRAFHRSLDEKHMENISNAGQVFEAMMRLETSKRFQWEEDKNFDNKAMNQTEYLSAVI